MGLAVTGTVFGWVSGCESSLSRERQAVSTRGGRAGRRMKYRGWAFVLLLFLEAAGTLLSLSYQPDGWIFGSVLLMAMVLGCAIDSGA